MFAKYGGLRSDYAVSGWFDPKTRKVCIYLPHITNIDEIDKTFMHEIVSHKGLRGLLGQERFNALMEEVWSEVMTKADRDYYLDYISYMNGKSEEERQIAAADEFVAHFAESVDPDRQETVWEKIVSYVRKTLHDMGFNVRMNTEDLANLLYDSLRNYTSNANTSENNIMFSKTSSKQKQESLSEISRKFDEELQKQSEGTLEPGHIYQLGRPGAILRSTGFPDAPIELSARHLADKAAHPRHQFDIAEMKGLVDSLQNPVAVFSYGDRSKAQNVIVEIQHNGKNYV